MIVALVGLFGSPDGSRASDRPESSASRSGQTTNVATTTPASAPGESDVGQASDYNVVFPAGTRITGNTLTVNLLKGVADPRNPGELTLAIDIRGTSTVPWGTNFSSTDFLLDIGDTNRAPVNFFSDVLDYRTSKDAVLEFAVPDAPRTFTLIAFAAAAREDEIHLPIVLRQR
jgi:hypothetical protein